MLAPRPLDTAFPKQLPYTTAPVVTVSLFTSPEADTPARLAARQRDANGTAQRPGLPSAQRHRAVCASGPFIDFAVRASVARDRATFTHPDFVHALGTRPSSAIATPHLLA